MDTHARLVMVITTIASHQEAEALAAALIEHSLAACVQVDGPITSWYRWNGKVDKAREYRLMIKTTQSAWPTLQEKLVELHPYDEPQIIKIQIDEASEGYRDWVITQTT
ncbi:MAG: divalent-cation tolerance protein CutA [Rubripirellula sp.]